MKILTYIAVSLSLHVSVYIQFRCMYNYYVLFVALYYVRGQCGQSKGCGFDINIVTVGRLHLESP